MFVLYIISKTAVWILLKLFAGGEFYVKDSQLFLLFLCTGLLKMIVGVLTTCHTQCTWDRSM